MLRGRFVTEIHSLVWIACVYWMNIYSQFLIWNTYSSEQWRFATDDPPWYELAIWNADHIHASQGV